MSKAVCRSHHCQRQLKNVNFCRKGMSFFAGEHTSIYSLDHHITCRFEARQALIYQLVLGLMGKNDMYNYSKAVHVYPPFFDITCSAKNYKIAPALTPEVANDGHLSTIDYRINLRPGRFPKVSDNAIDWTRYIEKRKSSVRCKVEHIFRIIKCQFGYRKVRYWGLKKNENRLYAMFACANLYALAIAGQRLQEA